MNKKKKVAGVENKEYIFAMRELRRSSAAGSHKDKRDRRTRTRLAKFERALKDFQ